MRVLLALLLCALTLAPRPCRADGPVLTWVYVTYSDSYGNTYRRVSNIAVVTVKAPVAAPAATPAAKK